MPPPKTLYEILDIPADASPQDVESGYQRALDVFRDDSLASYALFSPEEAERARREIELAYAVLKRQESRGAYDAALQSAADKGQATVTFTATFELAASSTVSVSDGSISSVEPPRAEKKSSPPVVLIASPVEDMAREVPAPAPAPAPVPAPAPAAVAAPAEPEPSPPPAQAVAPAVAAPAEPQPAPPPAPPPPAAPPQPAVVAPPAAAPSVSTSALPVVTGSPVSTTTADTLPPLPPPAPQPDPNTTPLPSSVPVSLSPTDPAAAAPAALSLSQLPTQPPFPVAAPSVAPPPPAPPEPPRFRRVRADDESTSLQLARATSPSAPPAPQVETTPAAGYPAPLPDEGEINGAVLQRLRETRGISLRQLSDSTKVSVHYLKALEANQFNELPGRVYLRGFLIQLGRAFRVNPEKLATRYLTFADRFRNPVG